jgi:DNA-binding XRE family transcriptional regulator
MARKSRQSFETEQDLFPSRLRQLMDTPPKTTQETLAKALNITRQAVGNYKSGQSSPDFNTLVKIAKYFNVSTDWLLGISEVQSQNTDLKAVCEYTMLSEAAIEKLLAIKDYPLSLTDIDIAKEKVETFFYEFSKFIESTDFTNFICTLMELENAALKGKICLKSYDKKGLDRQAKYDLLEAACKELKFQLFNFVESAVFLSENICDARETELNLDLACRNELIAMEQEVSDNGEQE